ncbi:MAG: type II secretion system F family protein [Phycisphaerales bacterium]|nr:type II secretion system F family protein [Phycisphaerales bacterium]
MPNFEYESLTDSGSAAAGVIDAPDRHAAIQLLAKRGEVATSLQEVGSRRAAKIGRATPVPRASDAGAGRRWGFASRRPTLGRADMAALIRELATAIEAGLPILQGLRTVRRQCSSQAMAVILDHLIERVEAGSPLYRAAREYGEPFDDLVVGMLRAADASGRMAEILIQLADLLDRSVELRREVLGATIYPLILLLLMIGSVVLIVTVVVPNLLAPLKDGMNMPLPTQVLLDIASFMQHYWIYLIGGLILAVVAWKAWINLPANRLKFDDLLLRIPVLGQLLRDVAVARFTRTLGTLAAAGMPILDALRVTRDTLGNRALMQAIDAVSEKVTAGKALADPLERSGLFPPLLIQIVNLGERSGRLETMLVHAADAFDRKVNASVKVFNKMLPLVLVLIMAVLAGFILSAILLPLLELQSLVQ